jgi:hypothetical protein
MTEFNIGQNANFNDVYNRFSGTSPGKHIRATGNRLFTNTGPSMQSARIKTGWFNAGAAENARRSERTQGAKKIEKLLDANYSPGTGQRLLTMVGNGRDLTVIGLTGSDLDALHEYTRILDERKQQGGAATLKARMEDASEYVAFLAERSRDAHAFLRGKEGDPALPMITPYAKPYFDECIGEIGLSIVLGNNTFDGWASKTGAMPADVRKRNNGLAIDAYETAMAALIGGEDAGKIRAKVDAMPDNLLRMYAAIADGAAEGAKRKGCSADMVEQFERNAVSNFFALRYASPALTDRRVKPDANATECQRTEAEQINRSLSTVATMVLQSVNKRDGNDKQTLDSDLQAAMKKWIPKMDVFTSAMIKRGRELNATAENPDQPRLAAPSTRPKKVEAVRIDTPLVGPQQRVHAEVVQPAVVARPVITFDLEAERARVEPTGARQTGNVGYDANPVAVPTRPVLDSKKINDVVLRPARQMPRPAPKPELQGELQQRFEMRRQNAARGVVNNGAL